MFVQKEKSSSATNASVVISSDSEGLFGGAQPSLLLLFLQQGGAFKELA